jgi:hypothetical protein
VAATEAAIRRPIDGTASWLFVLCDEDRMATTVKIMTATTVPSSSKIRYDDEEEYSWSK